jgi:hypothetical protein
MLSFYRASRNHCWCAEVSPEFLTAENSTRKFACSLIPALNGNRLRRPRHGLKHPITPQISNGHSDRDPLSHVAEQSLRLRVMAMRKQGTRLTNSLHIARDPETGCFLRSGAERWWKKLEPRVSYNAGWT